MTYQATNSDFTPRESTAVERLLASRNGRVARFVMGGALLATGLLAVPKPAGTAIAAFGLVPIATGVFNLCPIAPLWGGHFFGSRYCGSAQHESD